MDFPSNIGRRGAEKRRSAGYVGAILVFEDNVAASGSVSGGLWRRRRWKRIVARADHIHGVDNTGNPTQDGQTDVDQEVSTTSALQEDTQRRQDDGENDLANITGESS